MGISSSSVWQARLLGLPDTKTTYTHSNNRTMKKDCGYRSVGETHSKVRFCERWDKLGSGRFRVGGVFTTFRKWSNSKGLYYESLVGKVLGVECCGKVVGKAKLLRVKYVWADELSNEFMRNDTYSNWGRKEFEDLLVKFYGTSNVFGLVLEFRIVEVN